MIFVGRQGYPWLPSERLSDIGNGAKYMHLRIKALASMIMLGGLVCSGEAVFAQATATHGDQPSQSQPVPAKKTYVVPAGTKVLLELRSGINTRSAKPGDGVYLASTFPVVVGNRVMIPAGVYVQGVVDRVVRAGRIKGRAQLDMHFTSIIFPNGTVAEIPGVVNSLPGARKQSVKNDGEGTIEESGDKGRHAGEVAKVSVPTGATVGAIGGLDSGHPLAGGIAGVGAGLAAAGLVSLFTRGADVNIPQGTQVEMVLQRPLVLEAENLTSAAAPGAATPLVPAADQPRPMAKPDRVHILCPAGGLGCQ
jgi:type IV secretion system protein VirB10